MKRFLEYTPSRLIKLNLTKFGIDRSDCYIYLDYLNHENFSGNKLRKLYGSICFMKERDLDTIITIGGNYSNYLHAVSFLPELMNINCILIIKGHEPTNFGHTLNAIRDKKIPLHFYPKEKIKEELDTIISELKLNYPQAYFIPEGGSNDHAHLGFKSLIKNHFDDCHYICVPVGTLGSYKGIEHYLSPETKLVGYAAHCDYSLNDQGNISFDYHFGGFAKMNDDLFEFIQKFNNDYQVLLDPIYTSKMMYGIIHDYHLGKYNSEDKVVAIHTGGLQGWHGMMERNKKYNLKLT